MKHLLALSLFAAACGTSSPGATGDGYGNGLGTPDSPVPQSADQGPYAVTTTMDFTVEAVLPPQAELVVATLRDFSQNPARTLIDVASQEGVPAVGQLYGLLPSVLTDQLEGWINDEINKVKIGGKPITQWAGDVASLADTALTKFAIDSKLAITPGGATHTWTGIDFHPAGINAKVEFGGVLGDILTQTPTISVAQAGALSIGDQHFGLNYGEYAWQAINAVVVATTGGDLRVTLGKAVNCVNVAAAVANKCVLGVCVGHATLVDQICEGGLDALVDQVHARFADLRIDAVHYASGAATLVDVDGDGVADQIANGTWDAELNLGLGLRHAPATFTATR